MPQIRQETVGPLDVTADFTLGAAGNAGATAVGLRSVTFTAAVASNLDAEVGPSAGSSADFEADIVRSSADFEVDIAGSSADFELDIDC